MSATSTPLVPLGRPGSRRQGRPLVPWAGPAPANILVLRFSSLGDVLLTTPALDALRSAFPSARLVYAVKERFAALIERHPAVSKVVPLRDREGVRAYARRLAAEGPFDAILDLHGKLRSRALRLLLPAPRRTAVWTVRDRFATLPTALYAAPYRAEVPTADRFHAAAEELCGQALARGTLRVTPDPAVQDELSTLLLARGVDPTRPIVGLSPGAAWTTKAWPVERWVELAGLARAGGMQVVVQGAASERALCAQVAKVAGVVDLSTGLSSGLGDGALDVRGLVALVSRCAVFVAGDTGPMHVARALGVPTVAIFGSTDPGMFEWEGHAVVTADGVACAPCSFHGRKRCPRGHLKCLREIDGARVWGAALGLLGSPGARSVKA